MTCGHGPPRQPRRSSVRCPPGSASRRGGCGPGKPRNERNGPRLAGGEGAGRQRAGSGPARLSNSGMTLRVAGLMRSTTNTVAARSAGRPAQIRRKASTPPADPPITTMSWPANAISSDFAQASRGNVRRPHTVNGFAGRRFHATLPLREQSLWRSQTTTRSLFKS